MTNNLLTEVERLWMKGETIFNLFFPKSRISIFQKIRILGGEHYFFKLINYSPRQWAKLPYTYGSGFKKETYLQSLSEGDWSQLGP